MKTDSVSEKLIIQEVTKASLQLSSATRTLSIGVLIKLIRKQLGMPQQVLSKRSGVPQSTISRIEQGQRDTSILTLQKILSGIACDLVIAPLLTKSIDTLKKEQAKKIATKQISYLKGTMNLEKQEPDPNFMEELLKQEEERLLQGPNADLWKE